MGYDTVGVDLTHLNFTLLLFRSYLQTFDGPVNCMAVGVPPIQREMCIRVTPVDRAVGSIYLPD
ncbi:hypothetical protein ES703_53865 [subsurface metagenome]